MSRREYPSDYTRPSSAWLVTAQPRTATQALMEAAPHEDPKQSLEEEADLRAVIADAIRHLPAQDAFIIEARYYERLVYEEIGERLGVSRQHATRLCDAAEALLQMILQQNPIVRERLGIMSYWENYAEQALISLVPLEAASVVNAIDEAINLARNVGTNAAIAVGFMVNAGEYALAELIRLEQYNVTEMVSLLAYKQRMYGHRNILDFGLQGLLVRMADKRSRLANIAANIAAGRDVDDRGEGRIDTLRDLVGYAVITIMLHEGNFTSELEPF